MVENVPKLSLFFFCNEPAPASRSSRPSVLLKVRDKNRLSGFVIIEADAEAFE